ncbi:hypothetical protein HFM85_12480 [Blautia schinkii]|uniref:hypothetical protein n=1 Tax=Blautia schinkii TaxID=180164 RepID=UPI00156D7B6C|nr:hypothetical protein [Blautia schinkii]NSG83169.1 hypothetical protein [Blautia schinkii]NSK23775.1 hypothetical protein [Blautia schinkii]NSK26812.1 hypothetical protein [Blautia schinkii]NSK32921.1 hypothetical protein [Blautia schinkii]NSK50316.1 hypothetical protein [Blautia schinkii]
MAEVMTVSSSQGRPAEWHDQRLTTPTNADKALENRNEHWIGDKNTTDADKFNAIFQESVDKFNAKQTRPSRKMGMESTKPERQKSYYDGIVDGTFCYGKGDMQETAIHEAVLQVGNKDDNGVTDTDFDMEQWKVLKKSGHEKEASEYALAHLNKSENTERTKRILHRAVDRIANLDPEHLVVIRADYHGDEPCGTGHGHIAYVLRATGYEKGMDARVGSVTALKQMGFEKTPDKEYGITQLHERFKEIIAEEMVADALEYGYEAIQRAPDSGEHRKHSTVGEFRLLAAERQDVEEVKKANEKQKLANEEDAQKNREDTDSIIDSVIAQQIESFALERKEKSLDAQQKNIKLVREDTVKALQTLLDAEDENDLYELQTLFDKKVKSIEADKQKIKTEKENLATEKEELKKSQDEMDLRLETISLRETALDDVKLDLDERKKKQEEDEAAFQVKEDALEAQKLVNETKEAEVEKQKLENETKETKLNQRDAELDKKANAIDTLIADAESYKSPVDIAKHVLNILKESMTAEGQRYANKFIGIIDRNSDSLNQKYQMQVDEIRTKREQIKQGVYFDTDEQQDEFDRSK